MADARAPIPFIDLAAQQRLIRPRIDAAIARVLDHGQYIMGPEVAELERQLADYTGAKHALSCASGTDALLIAMMAWGVKPGDAVLCPAFTYTATPETIALLGATPVFVDVDEATFNIDPAGLEAGIEAAQHAGLRPVGLIAVDLFGLPADYPVLRSFAREHGLWVLADAAQSFGASVGGKRVGNFGDVTATSFFPAKPLGCYGDGGAIFTDDDRLAEIMASIRLHGKGDGKYDIVRVGVNGRLDTLQAAVLIEKLAIFDGELAARQHVAARYTAALADLVAVPTVSGGAQSAWAQYTIRVPAERRSGLAKTLQADGVPTNVYYPRPLHHQTAYRHFPVAADGLAVSERLSREVLSLPMHPYLSEADQDRIVESVRSALLLSPFLGGEDVARSAKRDGNSDR
jgi:dTDP-4-amino-4,6-dideoxygalactose transaminase